MEVGNFTNNFTNNFPNNFTNNFTDNFTHNLTGLVDCGRPPDVRKILVRICWKNITCDNWENIDEY